MSLKAFFQKQLLRFKYRSTNAAAVAVFPSNDEKRKAFPEQLSRLLEEIVPSIKSNAEVRAFLSEKYSLIPKSMSEAELSVFRANFILNHRPELLKTPEFQINQSGKPPKRSELLKMSENGEQRFLEARSIPPEKLPLEISKYAFETRLKNDFPITFELTFEDRHDLLFIGSVIQKILTDSEKQEVDAITGEILLFKGISQEDMEKRTPRFLSYAHALMHQTNL